MLLERVKLNRYSRESEGRGHNLKGESKGIDSEISPQKISIKYKALLDEAAIAAEKKPLNA